jgi:uncharacterized protein
MERNTATIERLARLADSYGLSALYVFGSRALEIKARLEGRETEPTDPATDLDIGVQPERGRRLPARERVEIALALEGLFGVKRVDLVAVPEAGPFLALEIIRGELIYCRDPDQQAEDELYILRRAGDLAYFEKERRRMIIEEGAR